MYRVPCASPYFGQAGWFLLFASEKLPSAIERYQNEVLRVLGVLERTLSTSAHGYLVGDKASVVDLSFITCVFFRVSGFRSSQSLVELPC